MKQLISVLEKSLYYAVSSYENDDLQGMIEALDITKIAIRRIEEEYVKGEK